MIFDDSDAILKDPFQQILIDAFNHHPVYSPSCICEVLRYIIFFK